jgi:hypothetical protein
MSKDLINNPTWLIGKKVKMMRGGNLLDMKMSLKEYFNTKTGALIELNGMGNQFPITVQITPEKLTLVHDDDMYAISFNDVKTKVYEQRLIRDLQMVNAVEFENRLYTLFDSYGIATFADAIDFISCAIEIESEDGYEVESSSGTTSRFFIYSPTDEADIMAVTYRLSFEMVSTHVLNLYRELSESPNEVMYKALNQSLKTIEHGIKHGRVTLLES